MTLVDYMEIVARFTFSSVMIIMWIVISAIILGIILLCFGILK